MRIYINSSHNAPLGVKKLELSSEPPKSVAPVWWTLLYRTRVLFTVEYLKSSASCPVARRRYRSQTASVAQPCVPLFLLNPVLRPCYELWLGWKFVSLSRWDPRITSHFQLRPHGRSYRLVEKSLSAEASREGFTVTPCTHHCLSIPLWKLRRTFGALGLLFALLNTIMMRRQRCSLAPCRDILRTKIYISEQVQNVRNGWSSRIANPNSTMSEFATLSEG